MSSVWERQEGEPNRWYDRFVRYYLRVEGERSLLGAYRRYLEANRPEKVGKGRIIGDAPSWWRRQAATWSWKERAEAYDGELRRLDGIRWEKQREEIRELSWNLAKRLWDKANAMLAFPVSEQQVEQDGQTVIIKPARWTFRDAAVIAETADRLARLAVGLPTEHTESEVEGEVTVTHEGDGKSPWDLLDEALWDTIIGQVERADVPPEDTGDDDDDDWGEAAPPVPGAAGPDDGLSSDDEGEE